MPMRRYLTGLLLLAAMAAAQTPQKEIPRLYDGKPDLNGVWDIPYTADMSRGVPGGLPFTPEGAADFKNYDPSKFDYTGHCLPAGLTRLVNTPMPMEIVQTPKKTVFLFEGFSSYIVVPTDGRKHTKDPDPTWYGESSGWHEGDDRKCVVKGRSVDQVLGRVRDTSLTCDWSSDECLSDLAFQPVCHA